jgi:hypothetical protein
VSFSPKNEEPQHTFASSSLSTFLDVSLEKMVYSSVDKICDCRVIESELKVVDVCAKEVDSWVEAGCFPGGLKPPSGRI